MATFAVIIEQEIERLNVLRRIDEKHPKRIKNLNKFSTYLIAEKNGYALNEKGKKELKSLEQKHKIKEDKKMRGIFFEPRIIKYVSKEQELETTFFKYCEKVSEENEKNIPLEKLKIYSTGNLASIVENWQDGAIVYAASFSLMKKYNLRELPRTGRLKKIKNELFFEPYYLFDIKSNKSLNDLQTDLKKILPNTTISLYENSRNLNLTTYYPYLKNYNASPYVYTLTCYNKMDASFAKLFLDVEVSIYDRSNRN
jgi:hypothetical protein